MNGIAAAIVFLLALPATADETRRSGFDFMTPETQAMQRDDLSNPGMLWVKEGEVLWNAKAGPQNRACADCHASIRGAAARYPSFDEKLGRPVDLQGRLNLCRQRHQDAEPFALEGQEMLSLSAYVANQSRGLPIESPRDDRLKPFIARGKALFETRLGQLNLSCAGCHDDNPGQKLGGSTIPQGHPTGYPLYRLEWQALGSLQRRLRNCMIGVRAEPYAFGSQDFVELELFLMSRAKGLPIETPAVRP